MIIASNHGRTAVRAHQGRHYLSFKMCAAQQFRVQQQASLRAAFQHWATVSHVTQSLSNKVHTVHKICIFALNHQNQKMQFSTNSPSVTSPDKWFGSKTLCAFYFDVSLLLRDKGQLLLNLNQNLTSPSLFTLHWWVGLVSVPLHNGKKTFLWRAYTGWLVKYLPSWSFCFLPQLPVPRVCTVCFFFHAVKSCVKNLCRNSCAITYRNLFFCLMIRILKIWVVSG